MTPEERAGSIACDFLVRYMPSSAANHSAALISDAIRAAVEEERAKYTALIEAADVMLAYFPANRDAVTEDYRAARNRLKGDK